MPDTSLVDWAGIAGAFVAAIIAGLGFRKGEKDKNSLPAPNESLAGGVFMGLDSNAFRDLLEELRDIHADLAAWRKEDDIRMSAERSRTTDHRLDRLEGANDKILDALSRIETREQGEVRRR